MLAVRTPGAPQAAREDAAFDSAFPFERQGRLLQSRSISGLFSRSLHSGLQPPCLRFAMAVTGHHARLGTRLLARLYRGRYLKRRSSTRFQGATLIKPDVPDRASGSPTGFTVGHTEKKPGRKRVLRQISPSPFDTAVSDGSCH